MHAVDMAQLMLAQQLTLIIQAVQHLEAMHVMCHNGPVP